jgi:ubiquinone/menaquinone biosynthesis C-methylase UbiE
MTQLNVAIEALRLCPDRQVLDLGCGTGMISEYIADCTGAHVTGLDYIPQAIQQAQKRTAAKSDRLSFVVADITALDLPDHSYDAIIAIDTIYFSNDYADTICRWTKVLRPNGQVALFYSYGRESWMPREQFPCESLAPEHTPLADALKANGLRFQTWDFTDADYHLAQLRKAVLIELRPHFEAEGIMFVYDNRMGDAEGFSHAIEEGLHVRYLYHVQLPKA